ncbi:MAG: hypothetical protein IPJ94_19705 [Chloroflexi bacterium]|nr:hypothetical protein [Chloroflexota bacterium]
MADAAQAAQSESHSSFGSDHILLEKYFTEVHHVEIQVLGTCTEPAAPFERECSVQRRHQKIIEESPSPIVQFLRRRGGFAAAHGGSGCVSLGAQAGYVSAGTVEFVVDPRRVLFLEMNTRLQVEHPVTELVTGLIWPPGKFALPPGSRCRFWANGSVSSARPCLECRVYAEDPARTLAVDWAD